MSTLTIKTENGEVLLVSDHTSIALTGAQAIDAGVTLAKHGFALCKKAAGANLTEFEQAERANGEGQ